jgi:hypothetical protein
MNIQFAPNNTLVDSLTIIHFQLDELKNKFPEIENSASYKVVTDELESVAISLRSNQITLD